MEYPLAQFPPSIHLELTNSCNLRCRLCYCKEMKRARGYIELDLVRKLADEIGERQVVVAPFLHGESFLHPQFLKIAQILKAKSNVFLTLDTNATLLDPKVAQGLVETGVDALSISFHGARKETYESIMQGASYEKVVANLEGLFQIRERLGKTRPEITFTFVLDEGNESEVEDFRRLWQERADRLIVKEQIDSSARFRKNFQVKRAPCDVLWKAVIVLYNGDVTLCCKDYEGAMKVGNLRESSLAELWCGETYQKVRQLHLEGRYQEFPFCHDCEAWYAYEAFEALDQGEVTMSRNQVLRVYQRKQQPAPKLSLLSRLAGLLKGAPR